MNALSVLSSPWAILPEKLQQIVGIYDSHLRQEVDLQAIEAQYGQSKQQGRDGYEIQNGVALISVQGVLAKRMNMFSKMSGATSTELIGRDVAAAVNDSEVRAIVLMVDSPGGTVDGTQALANIVAGAAEKKPVVTWADGMIASAAYWVGAAAGKVYLSGPTTMAGAIGVVSQHVDYSGREAMLGVKTTEIYAGKYKRIASEHAPLTKDGKEYVQAMVDQLYSSFVGDVAKFRGRPANQVLDSMADGRIFIGQQAIGAGLADGMTTLDSLVASL